MGTAGMNRHRSTGRLEQSRPVANGAGHSARGQQRKLALGGIGAFNTRKYERFWRLMGAGSRAHCSEAVLLDGPGARIGRILVVALEAMCPCRSYPPALAELTASGWQAALVRAVQAAERRGKDLARPSGANQAALLAEVAQLPARQGIDATKPM